MEDPTPTSSETGDDQISSMRNSVLNRSYFSDLQAVENKNIIIVFLGEDRTDKSFLLNFLKLIQLKTGGNQCEDFGEAEERSELIQRVSNNLPFVVFYYIESSPELEENEIIANAFLFKRVVSLAQSVKFIMIYDLNKLCRSNYKSLNYIEMFCLILKICRLLQYNIKCPDIGVVFSNCEPNVTKEDVLEKLKFGIGFFGEELDDLLNRLVNTKSITLFRRMDCLEQNSNTEIRGLYLEVFKRLLSELKPSTRKELEDLKPELQISSEFPREKIYSASEFISSMRCILEEYRNKLMLSLDGTCNIEYLTSKQDIIIQIILLLTEFEQIKSVEGKINFLYQTECDGTFKVKDILNRLKFVSFMDMYCETKMMDLFAAKLDKEVRILLSRMIVDYNMQFDEDEVIE